MPKVIDKILRMGEGKILRQLQAIAKQVNALEDDFVAMSDDELRGMTAEFKTRLEAGETLDDLMPEAFATVREAAKRVLGQRHFDVQIMGGAALHLGNIAEMKTGEGKTLVATLPSYLNALSGNGVHVVTVNDYLAKYHAEWMGRVHHFLGLTIDVILPTMTPAQRREAYAADITYGTNNEFGFDYLRDNMADDIAECVQRGHNFAIVDEVDSILIDEARTPLIISGPTEDEVKWYGEFATIVEAHEARRRTTRSTRRSAPSRSPRRPSTKVEDQLGIDNLYDAVNTPLIGFLNNAIKAKELFKNDKDYVVIDGEVLIVDEHTGRILDGRRYNEGLHQAIEAKEGVRIREEYQTLATITLQNYFRLYDKLCGMTGTAMTEASEFDKIYKLGVVADPDQQADRARRPARPRLPHRGRQVRRRRRGHRRAPRERPADPRRHHERREERAPLQACSRSAASPTRCSTPSSTTARPRSSRWPVTRAPSPSRPTWPVEAPTSCSAVSVEFLADAALRAKGLDPLETPEEYEAAWPETLERDREAGRGRARRGRRARRTRRHRHRAPRVAPHRQPAAWSFRPSGRPGRDPVLPVARGRPDAPVQGRLGQLDPADQLKIPDDVPIENKRVTNAIASAQAQVEAQNFDTRKNILKYDDVMSRQREVIYAERRRVLEGEDMYEWVREMIADVTGLRHRRHRGIPRRVGPRRALDGARHAVPRLGVRRRPRGRGRRSRGADPRDPGQHDHRRCP